MPFVNRNIASKLARINFTPPKHNDRTSYFQQYLSIIKRNTTRLKRSDSTETLPDNSDRSYKSRCSSIDDIVEYSMKPEFQIEQQLYDELREQVNSCQNPAKDDYDIYNAPKTNEYHACTSTNSIDFKEENSPQAQANLILKPSRTISESLCCSSNNFSNNKPIFSPNYNNSKDNNKGNNLINKTNLVEVRQINGRRPLPDLNNIKSKQSAISKRRLDYSKIISVRNQKIISSRNEKTKMSRTEIQAQTKTNDVILIKKLKKNRPDLGIDCGKSGGCRKKCHKYNDFRRGNVNNVKLFNQDKLRKELKYLRDRHLSDAVLANEIRKLTLSS